MRQYLTSLDWIIFYLGVIFEVYVLGQLWRRTTTVMFPTLMGFTIIELGSQYLAVMLGATPIEYANICAWLGIFECLFMAATAVELSTRLLPHSKVVLRAGPMAVAVPIFCGAISMPPVRFFAIIRMSQLAMMLSLMLLLGCLARNHEEMESRLARAYATMLILVAAAIEAHFRLGFTQIGRRAEPVAWIIGLVIIACAARRSFIPMKLTVEI